MRRALFGSACESVLAGGLWDAGGQIPAEGTQVQRSTKTEPRGINPVLELKTGGDHAYRSDYLSKFGGFTAP